jgi:hypothetical protein
MRMYVLAGLCGALSLYFFLRWLGAEGVGSRSEETGGRMQYAPTSDFPASSPLLAYRALALCALATVAALYTIFLMATVVLVENLVTLIVLLRATAPARRRMLGRWVVAQGAVLVVVGAWLTLSWGRMSSWAVGEPSSLRLVARLYATLLATGVSEHLERYTVALILPLLMLALGVALYLRALARSRALVAEGVAALTLLLTVLGGGAAIYLATQPRGLFYVPRVEARYFVPFAPAFWVLLAWAVGWIRRRWRVAGWLSAGALLALAVAFLPGYYQGRVLHDRLQTMTRTILSQAQAGDVVVLDSGGRYPLFFYDYERAGTAAERPPVVAISPAGSTLSAAEAATALAPVAATARRVWLAEVDVALTDPQRYVEQGLRGHYRETLLLRYGYNLLHLYDASGAPLTLALAPGYVPQHPLEVAVGTGGQLRGWELPVAEYSPGETAHVSLLWATPPREAVSVALRNARGQELLRRQSEPGGPQRQQFDFAIYPRTPAGRYEIVLAPPPATGEVLGALDVVGTTPLPRGGAPVVATNARVGEEITLLGYTLRDARGGRLTQLAPGQTFLVELTWRAERKPTRDDTVFVHLLGQAFNPRTQGPLWAQHDAQPADNGYPTRQWLVGDAIVDRHTLTLDEGAPEGDYRLEVGMYTEDGQRLMVQSGGATADHLLLPTSLRVTGR